MKPSPPTSDPHDHARELIAALCDETITHEQMTVLETLIRDNAEIRRLYIRSMHLHASLYRHGPVLATRGLSNKLPFLRPRVIIPSIAAAGLALAAGLLFSSNKKPVPPGPPPQATYVAMADAEWDSAGPPKAMGQGMAVGLPYALLSGCVELDFNSGCHAILEGPANFTVVSGTQVDLQRGRISATMSGGGFDVRTPTGIVKDLGTRFGVAVSPDGTTEVDVFEGRVTAAMRTTDGKVANQVMVYEEQSVRVTRSGVDFDPNGAVPQRFVTRLTSDFKSLDVVDLLSGGDGTTRRRGTAIDATTGRFGVLPAVGPRQGTLAFRPVSGLAVVDGCFVPDGTKDDNIVDSAGDHFRFPATTATSINNIWTGGIIPWFKPAALSTVLGGKDYSTPDHSLLCIHSNNGLTLDLDKICRIHPGRSIARLRCKVANSYVNAYKAETGCDSAADVFVIVDGVSKFERRHFINRDGVFDVDVALNGGDRFLTLATTDGGDGINDDWVLWADPVLYMSSR